MSKAKLKFKFNNKIYNEGDPLDGDVEAFAEARGYVEIIEPKKSDASREA